MPTTVYDINVRYRLDDKASRGLRDIDKKSRKAGQGVGLLHGQLRSMAVAATGFLSFRLGKKLLVDYNREIEQAKIQMAGLTQLNMGGEWARNQERANYLVRQFQDDAKASVGTTKDFVDVGSMLVGPLTRAGASMKDVTEFTKGAVIASKAFGVESEFAVRDIEQALAGTLSSKDRFARALLEPLGTSVQDFNKLVKKSPEEARKAFQDALTSPAIQRLAKEQEKSFDGVTSTLEDNLQRAFGRIGLPLVQRLTKEFAKLNDWFDNNPERLAELTDRIGNALVGAVDAVKSIFGFVERNAGTLLTLGKLYLGGRVIKGAIGIGQGIMGGISTFGAALQTVVTGGAAGGGLLAFGRALGPAASGLAALYAGAKLIATEIDRAQTERIDRTTDNPLLRERARLLGGATAGAGTGISTAAAAGIQNRGEVAIGAAVVKEAKRAGFLGPNNQVNVGQLQKQFDLDTDTLKALGGGSLQGFAKMSAREQGEALQRSLRVSFSEDKKRASEFLLGLDRSFALDRQHSAQQTVAEATHMRAKWDELMTKHGGNLRQVTSDFAKQYGELNAGLARVLQQTSGKGVFARGRAVGGFLFQKFLDASEEARKNAQGDIADDRSNRKTKDVKVDIHNMQVVSDDPDIWAHGFIGAMDNMVKNPNQARRVLREG